MESSLTRTGAGMSQNRMFEFYRLLSENIYFGTNSSSAGHIDPLHRVAPAPFILLWLLLELKTNLGGCGFQQVELGVLRKRELLVIGVTGTFEFYFCCLFFVYFGMCFFYVRGPH